MQEEMKERENLRKEIGKIEEMGGLMGDS